MVTPSNASSPRKPEPPELSKGKQKHGEIQDDWEHDTNAEGKVIRERRILKRNRRTGRMDLYVEIDDDSIALIEIKNTDWNKMNADRVRANVLRHIRQVYDYMESEAEEVDDARRAKQRSKPDAEWAAYWDEVAVYPALVYTERPNIAARLAQIEQMCDENLIAVVWQDETIEERKARADAASAATAP